MELSRDDWELTLREFRSQKVQITLQTAVIDAALAMIRRKLYAFPEKKIKDEKPKSSTTKAYPGISVG